MTKHVLYSPKDLPNLIHAIEAMGFDKPVSVEFKHNRDSVSLKQYKLLYQWYGEIQAHLYETTGESYSTDELDDHFKHKFLPGKLMRVGTDYYKPSVSKRDLNTKTMSEYLDKLDHHCADNLGLKLSHPDDCYWDALMRD